MKTKETMSLNINTPYDVVMIKLGRLVWYHNFIFGPLTVHYSSLDDGFPRNWLLVMLISKLAKNAILSKTFLMSVVALS